MYHLKKQIDATLDSVLHHPSSMIWRAEKDGIRINKWSLKVGFRMDAGDGQFAGSCRSLKVINPYQSKLDGTYEYSYTWRPKDIRVRIIYCDY